jgi:histidine ammonia-lyase/tyrosine ammonia-lyase
MAEGHEQGKPQPGQIASARNLRSLTAGSQLAQSHESLATAMRAGANGKSDTQVFMQKAYSLRCIPQILGAVRDTLEFCAGVVERELNSSNDNPLFFGGEAVFHGGNFHGQHVAFAMDYLAIAATQVGVLSERRLNRLLNPHLNRALPEFLVSKNPGLRCGFAGAQYPATALVAENRTLCSPASIQSVPANGDNQDVVSMGLIAARTAKKIVDNTSYIIAIELLAACQAVDLLGRASGLSPAAAAVHGFVRESIPSLDEDRYMTDEIEVLAELIRKGCFVSVVQDRGIQLH